MNALRTAALGLCLILTSFNAFAECTVSTQASDDSISVSIDAVDSSASAREFAWLLASGINQLLHGEMTVLAEGATDETSHEDSAVISAFALYGGVLANNERVRVTVKLVSAAHSDVIWMDTFDRSIKEDANAAADEIASKAAQEIIEVTSDRRN